MYFLIFSLEGKFRKYDISVKRKHNKTNENMIHFCPIHKYSSNENYFFLSVHISMQYISACNFNTFPSIKEMLISFEYEIQLYIRDIGIRWLVENCKIVFSIAFRCFIEFSLGKFGIKIQKNFGNLLIY